MKIINNPPKKDWNALLQRPTQTVDDIENTVTQIFEDVQRNKDIAISKYTQLFDGVSLENTIVSGEEINTAIAEVSDALKLAIQQAKSNIEVFHTAQKTDKVVSRNQSRSYLLARKKTHSKSRLVHSRRYCTAFFNGLNVGSSSTNSRL